MSHRSAAKEIRFANRTAITSSRRHRYHKFRRSIDSGSVLSLIFRGHNLPRARRDATHSRGRERDATISRTLSSSFLLSLSHSLTHSLARSLARSYSFLASTEIPSSNPVALAKRHRPSPFSSRSLSLPFFFLSFSFTARQVFSLAFRVPRAAFSRFNLLAMHKALRGGRERHRRRRRARTPRRARSFVRSLARPRR